MLVDQTRQSLGEAILAELDARLGPGCGITVEDGGWRLERPAPAGSVVHPLGDFGHLAVPPGSGATGEAEGLARTIAARLVDFQAIERAGHHAARLESLYQASQEITSELNLDRTLQLIVDRGRELTGADICYLSLNDYEQGDTYIRVTSGTRSEVFLHIRLAYGDGLGGLVAKEGRPYYSRDYMHDERFVHVVDQEVSSEGVVSVVGVPLRLVDRVIGVLFIANRYRSSFSSEDVTFLQALGDHAAVAIENARLYGTLDRAARLHRRLTELVLTENPIEALEAEIGGALGLPVRVVPGPARPERGVDTPVRAGATVIGTLRVEATRLSEEQEVAVEQAARVVAVHLMKERAVAQAELRSRGELLDALVAGVLPGDELARRCAAFGLDVSATHRAVVYRGDQSADLARLLPAAFVAGRLGNTVALVEPATVLPSIAPAGVGPAAAGPDGIAASLVEASRLLEVAGLLGRHGLVRRDDLGVYSLLLDPQRSGELEVQSRSLLAPLLRYDEGHGPVLVPTLEMYLDSQSRPKEAAARLNLHVNTLYYRLARIRELSGWDLEDPEQRLQLHLACRVLRLASA